ncbi:ATP-binding protein [Spirillospora sp. NPDC048819]|uniref:ATP-binding protein n=1 Tax=Spirillospora sp. NPDC048819 TaxID=3155268 RepID=UPI0033D88552
MSVSTTAFRRRRTVPAGRRPPDHDGGDDYRDSIGMAALSTSIPLVRSFARAKLVSWGLETTYGWECQQVLSEMATNAFDVSGQPAPTDLNALDDRALAMILVQLRVSAGHLIAEVRDPSGARPELVTPGIDDEGGRGLQLVEALATTWGWYPITSDATVSGKVVWASWLLAPETDAS